MVPLVSSGFPNEVINGRFIGIGTRGCTEGKWRLAGMGVRMGMVDIVGMDDKPTDKFGIDPIPTQTKDTGKQEEMVNLFSRQTTQDYV